MNIPDEAEKKKRKLSSPKDEKIDEKRSKRDSYEENSTPKAKIKETTKSEKVCHFNSTIM